MPKVLNEYLKNIDAVLISSTANINYLVGNYGFSPNERECLLLITKKKKFIIIDKRYSEAIKKQNKEYEIIESGANYFIRKNSSELLNKLKIKTLGFEDNNLTVSEYIALKKSVKLKSVDLSKLRMIKTPDEIEKIKMACKIGDKAFDFILGKLKIGITEKEIAEFLITFFKSKNSDSSFNPIVAFGKNSSIPHHLSGNFKLAKNQIVLLDFGVKIDNYCSDMSRTIFFGIAPEKFKHMHATVLEAQAKAIEFVNSKSSMVNRKLLASDIDKLARDYIMKQGYPNIIHSVGHGIGIEVHEAPHISPSSTEIIKPEMIFSIEPGIYIENYGGVRIEDLVLATKKGVELISNANREIIELT